MTVFSLSDDQLALRDAVRRFCASRWTPQRARQVEHGGGDRWDAATFAELGQMGILGLTIPACYGGEGAAWLDCVVAYEELGRALFLSPHYASSVVSGGLLARFTSDEVRRRLLPQVASGEVIVTSCVLALPVADRPRQGPGDTSEGPITEMPGPRADDAAGLWVEDGRVSGRMRAVPYAEVAHYYLVVAPAAGAGTQADDGRGRSELLLVHHEPGSSRCERVGSIAGPPRHDVELASAPMERLTPDGIVGGEVERELTRAKLLLAAEAVGGAKSALDLAVAYASERQAFGQHIGSFQALQHKMADMATRIEVADTAVHFAARLHDADDPAIAVTALAVLESAQAYSFCARNAVQVYGGAGIMSDSHVSLHFRRSQVLEQAVGSRSQMEHLVAQDLLSDPVRGIPREITLDSPDDKELEETRGGMTFGIEKKLRQEFRQYFQRVITPEARAEIDESNDDYSGELYQELARSGYIGLSLPTEYGGRGLGYTELAIFEEEAHLAGLPHGVMSVLNGSAHFAAQLLVRIGTKEQRQQYLPAIMRGEYRFTQGFTEPECGSDLAAVRCFAEQRGNDFVLTGQKVFNSAHVVTHMLALVRSDRESTRHSGISLLMVDLRSPGVTLLPMYTMRGWRRNLVVFDETPVPGDALIGEKDRGWYALMSVIDLERSGIALPARRWRVLQQILHEIQGRPGEASEILGHESQTAALSEIYRTTLLGWLLSRKVCYLQDRGENVTALASFQKLFNGEAAERFIDAAVHLLGDEALIDRASKEADGTTASLGRTLSALYLDCRIWQIAGGSSEIQRNIIARRILRLPSA